MAARRELIRWFRALTLRTLLGYVVAIAAGVGFVVISAEVHSGAVDRVDLSTELSIHRLDSPVWDFFMTGASLIGSNPVLLPVVGLVMWLAIRRHKRAAAIILGLDAIAANVLDTLLKLVFARDRPTILDKIPIPPGYSFPSGHSMSAMGIWGVVVAVLILLYPRIKGPAIAMGALLIGAIGFSRIYLGAHWPFDVVGGLLGGIPLLVVSVHLLHRNPRRDKDLNLADLVLVEDKP